MDHWPRLTPLIRHSDYRAPSWLPAGISGQFLPRIDLPTLLINAANDPFPGPGCYPREEATASACFHLEPPETGGHVGFPNFGNGGEYSSETRTAEFLECI